MSAKAFRFDLLGWQEDLLAHKRRNVTRFDIGEIRFPFRRAIRPIGLGETVVTVLMGLFLVAFAIWLLSVPFEQGFTLQRVLVSGGLGLVAIAASFPFLYTGLVGRRRQVEVRIDRDAVEVTDRPPFRKRIHWREPLSSYTGVRCYIHRLTVRSGGQSMDMATHAIDLDHAQEDRIVPLYRSDRDGDVEDRWTRFAEALGLPKTGAFEPDIVTTGMFGIPIWRSGRKKDSRE